MAVRSSTTSASTRPTVRTTIAPIVLRSARDDGKKIWCQCDPREYIRQRRARTALTQKARKKR